MSELTPEERRSVEAGAAWVASALTPQAHRVAEALAASDLTTSQAQTAYGFACGHLSGFRAGVEAALEIVNRDFERGRLGSYTLDRIRALLAQESEHGS